MNIKNIITPVQDDMVNQLILENLLTKGNVNIEEAMFMNELIENIATRVFYPEVKQIEESFNQELSKLQSLNEANYQINYQNNIEQTKPVELNESTMVKLFLKK